MTKWCMLMLATHALAGVNIKENQAAMVSVGFGGTAANREKLAMLATMAKVAAIHSANVAPLTFDSAKQ